MKLFDTYMDAEKWIEWNKLPKHRYEIIREDANGERNYRIYFRRGKNDLVPIDN
jgi:hypothetical protein